MATQQQAFQQAAARDQAITANATPARSLKRQDDLPPGHSPNELKEPPGLWPPPASGEPPGARAARMAAQVGRGATGRVTKAGLGQDNPI